MQTTSYLQSLTPQARDTRAMSRTIIRAMVRRMQAGSLAPTHQEIAKAIHMHPAQYREVLIEIGATQTFTSDQMEVECDSIADAIDGSRELTIQDARWFSHTCTARND